MNSMMKRLFVSAVAVICFGLAGVIGWLVGVEFYGPRDVRGASTSMQEPVLAKAPSYQGLTNQLGQTVDSSRFKGKIQVVTFLFPYCTTYCPLIAAHLVGLEQLLADSGLQSKVQIVAFDVDPEGTGPKQMRGFMKEYGWNPKNLHWQYLTGKPKQIRHIITGGYHVDYQKVSDSQEAQEQGPSQTPQPVVVNRMAQKAHVNYDVTHNDALMLVDGNGNIRKIYDQADVLSNRRLLKAIKALVGPNG